MGIKMKFVFFVVISLALFAHLSLASVLTVQEFVRTNCGSPSDPTKLKTLSVSPDPIVLGKNVTASFSAYLSYDVVNKTDNTQITIDIYKEVLGVFVYIPCVDGVGSCPINNVCTKLHPKPAVCDILKRYHIPCGCPIPKGNYAIPPPGVELHLKNPGVSWLTDGNYKVKAQVNDSAGNRLICVQLIVSLAATNEADIDPDNSIILFDN